MFKQLSLTPQYGFIYEYYRRKELALKGNINSFLDRSGVMKGKWKLGKEDFLKTLKMGPVLAGWEQEADWFRVASTWTVAVLYQYLQATKMANTSLDWTKRTYLMHAQPPPSTSLLSHVTYLTIDRQTNANSTF